MEETIPRVNLLCLRLLLRHPELALGLLEELLDFVHHQIDPAPLKSAPLVVLYLPDQSHGHKYLGHIVESSNLRLSKSL